MIKRPTVLTIAGLDPSGCAGILADIKTFEAHHVSAMAVCTANTIQNVTEFNKPNWIPAIDILAQLNLLQKESKFDFVKIGLIENFRLLNTIINELLNHNPGIKIIWDPIYKASAQYKFHTGIDQLELKIICSKLFLITPNLDEIKLLVPETSPADAGKYLSQFCSVLVKGGHSEGASATDTLYSSDSIHQLESKKLTDFSKRGTGCVLSAAILSNLANSKDLFTACVEAKKYITNYLTSSNSLVGHHFYETHK